MAEQMRQAGDELNSTRQEAAVMHEQIDSLALLWRDRTVCSGSSPGWPMWRSRLASPASILNSPRVVIPSEGDLPALGQFAIFSPHQMSSTMKVSIEYCTV